MSSFEIFVPDKNQLHQEPKLAAMVLDCISSFDSEEQLIEVSGGMVLSGNKKLREVLTMIYRAKRFDEFLKQIREIFFNSDTGMGILRCARDGKELAYEVTEINPLPKMKWKVKRVT